MVQVLEKIPSFGEQIGRSIGQGTSEGISSVISSRQKMQELAKENEEIYKHTGFRLTSIDPEMRKKEFEIKLQGQQKELERSGDESYLNNLLGKGGKKTFEEDQPGLKTPKNKEIRNPVESMEEEGEFDPTKISDEQILKAHARKPGLGTALGKLKDVGLREKRAKTEAEIKSKERIEDKTEAKFQKEREFHTEDSRPIIEEANQRLKNAPIAKGLREQLRRDISSGEASGMFPYMVDKMGLESYRNPESARFSSAVKNLFVESLNDIPGARPNMFIERFLSNAQPNIGRSVEANLSVMDISDFVEDLKNEQARKEIEIAKEDREKFGFVKEDVTERARERMGDYANRKQEKMAMDIQQRHEKDMSDPDLINELIGGKVTPGSYVTPRTMKILFIKNDKDINKAVQEAKSLGLVMPEYLE